jgi:SAM-dependent methyltransferase
MDLATYAVEAEVEQTHWWFSGRRELFAREIERLSLPKTSPVLDVGTSTGTNLRVLREIGFRDVVGLDVSEAAIRFCELKGLGSVRQGDICSMPFPDASFDLVLATDIIEHIEDDRQAVQEIVRILRPGGHALITVPAFQSIWGLQDRVAHHKRRYRMRQLRERIESAGLVIDRAYYFNFLLFIPIWLARRAIDLFKIELKSENEVNSPVINSILTNVFAADLALAPILRPPFGVSIFMLVSKK